MAFEIMLFSIPEAVVITRLVKELSGAKITLDKLLWVGILTGICTGLLRLVINSLILSMISYAAVVVLLFWLFKATEIWKVAVSVGISLPLYLLVEVISVVVIQEIFSPDLEENLTNKFLVFLPQLVIMAVIVTLFTKANVRLFVGDSMDEGD